MDTLIIIVAWKIEKTRKSLFAESVGLNNNNYYWYECILNNYNIYKIIRETGF